MAGVGNYEFKYLIDKIVKLKESFINSYVNKCLESDSVIISTQRMCRIIDARYEKADLNKVMTKQCQHLNVEERCRLHTLL